MVETDAKWMFLRQHDQTTGGFYIIVAQSQLLEV